MSMWPFRWVPAALLLAAFAGANAGAEQNPYPLAAPPPVSVSNPFVATWNDAWMLACLTFTNTSDRTITAIRFGVTSTTQDSYGAKPTTNSVNIRGSFAPGVAIKPPTRFLGGVNRASSALQNCWPTPRYNVPTTLAITVQSVVYADGTVWNAPAPSTVATVSY